MNYVERLLSKLATKLTSEDFWIDVGEGILKIIAILIAAKIIIKLGKLVIENIFKVRSHSPLRISERRDATLSKLLKSILTYAIYFIALVMILSIFDIDVKALLAGAGIVGLAVGFGAQSLVKDIITGFFIIFEDQFSVGDFIQIGNFEGVVESIGLKTTKVKSWTGEVHIIPNGNITEVTNFSLHNSLAIVDVNVPYEGDINEVERVLEELLKGLEDKYEEMVSPPELLGIQSFGASEIVLRIVAETLPMQHAYIARMLRKEIKLCLDEHGIEIPLPRLVMYSRNEKEQQSFKKFDTH
ncbi:mechanosensitive ion channel family protein [Bacillus massilinigeriensis]|uniref:mechanosensitive ion channel family protein n=1 Tax=Bacillus massilionigeriensis TaxID=1805475 RepID=UPI00096ADF8C|nr:mechanosensitive ion channel family protein [Bacillus massilionigeriensis]